MRLLHVDDLRFEVFYRQFIPPFGILSHTWSHSRDDKEVSYKKFIEIQAKRSYQCETEYTNGYNKIVKFCEFIRTRRIYNFDEIRKSRPEAFDESDRDLKPDRLESLQWVWIDTCCIDDSSSMEVFEAINSMWSWYFFAEECFVYLVDLVPPKTFEQCRWFQRGWTLQELLAPRTKVFCDPKWEIIGYVGQKPISLPRTSSWDMENLTYPVHKRTKIPRHCLEDRESIAKTSIAQRLSWAVGRDTLKVEDRFYCLLGVLGVNMYPLYGEGVRGFYRLQEEIIKSSRDQSLFCWRYVEDENPGGYAEDARIPVGMFAPHIGCFQSCDAIEELPSSIAHHVSSRSFGLKMRVQAQELCAGDASKSILHLATLGNPNKDTRSAANKILMLECKHDEDVEFYRSRCNDVVSFGAIKNLCCTISGNGVEKSEPKTREIYIEKIRFLQTQCKECRMFDEQVATRVDLINSNNRQARGAARR